MRSLRAPAFAVALCLSACASPSPESLAANDPWEETNRDVFAFDVWIEHHIAAPVDDGYRAVVPEPAREGLHNMVTNLHAPIVLANDVIQARPKKAVNTLARIVLNTTFGLGGLIDIASKVGIPYHDNDFGITLGQSGVQEGSYLVLPFIGPLPPRDLLGSSVDGFFDPLSWAHFHGKDTWMLARGAFRVLDTVDDRRNEFDTIERTSIDFYATTRNLDRQSRDAQIRGENSKIQLPDF